MAVRKHTKAANDDPTNDPRALQRDIESVVADKIQRIDALAYGAGMSNLMAVLDANQQHAYLFTIADLAKEAEAELMRLAGYVGDDEAGTPEPRRRGAA